MKKCIRFVGLDDSKDSIDVAVASEGRDGEVRSFGSIPNTPDAVRKLVRRLGRPKDLHFVYEAGPCGYGVYRELLALGANCMVAAPAMTPRRSGNRIKTDRRDALTLARLHRAGELHPVWVPEEETGHGTERTLDAAMGAGPGPGTHDLRARQLSDGAMTGGNQSTNIRGINRRGKVPGGPLAPGASVHQRAGPFVETPRSLDRSIHISRSSF